MSPKNRLEMLLLSAVVGGCAGALVALNVPSRPAPLPAPSSATSTSAVVATTSTVPQPELIKAERHPFSLIPPELLQRRASPVAALYRKSKGGGVEDRVLSDDRLLGQAVALTSDGWFVTHGATIASLSKQEISVWYGGRAYTPVSMVMDHMNGTAFLKVEARELTPSAFGDVSQLLAGEEFWIEPRTRLFLPTLVTSPRERVTTLESSSSEVAARRLLLYGLSENGDRGAPVWDSAGALIGLVESGPGEPVRVVPVTSVAASFGSLLNSGTIRHAVLGVRAVDLSLLRIDGDRGTLPLRGALVRDDHRPNKLAIIKDSPAAKAGLKAGDVIVGIERDILDGMVDLGELLSEYRPGTPVSLRILRDGIETQIPVTLGSTTTGETIK